MDVVTRIKELTERLKHGKHDQRTHGRSGKRGGGGGKMSISGGGSPVAESSQGKFVPDAKKIASAERLLRRVSKSVTAREEAVYQRIDSLIDADTSLSEDAKKAVRDNWRRLTNETSRRYLNDIPMGLSLFIESYRSASHTPTRMNQDRPDEATANLNSSMKRARQHIKGQSQGVKSFDAQIETMLSQSPSDRAREIGASFGRFARTYPTGYTR